MHNAEVLKLIDENSDIFWYINEEDKCNISLEFLIETILNYGNERSVKRLIDNLGIMEVARIFFAQADKPRCNYFPQVKNYFSLYFKRYAS
ncbi:MAG TPA: hypothetical protein DD381_08720 [Lentisphaeria bacterium]|nr:MAG: hypothetical protein A2X47_08125 [Lentisphaerae bacterium GWF2_38_69]HBM16406.1 hypothetical protein [Lentisphaeria bacterium]